MNLSADRIADLARNPAPFEVPEGSALDANLAADWAESAELVGQRQVARAGYAHPGRLQRDTLDFVTNGAAEGERSLRLFRAAGDLAEIAAVHGTDALVEALLTEAALDSGMTPAETGRQIRTGIEHARRQHGSAIGGGA